MDKIAVLIPCYNEEKTIAKVVADAKKALPEAVVYVYDNNSADRTVELAAQAGAVIRYEYLQGKGNVIRRMFREIDAECYVMVDGDDTYPMEYAPEMVDKVLTHNADMVVGDRLSSTYFTENKRPFHNMGNSFVKTFPVLSKGFEIETEMTIHAVSNNMQIENVIVDYRDRPAGSESKLNTYSDGIKVLGTIGRLYKDYKPLGFFSLLALLLAIISVIFFIPVLVDFVQTGLVAKFPTLFVCGFVMLAALQSFFSGLILSNMAIKNRRDFEIQLNMIRRHKMKDGQQEKS